jgi:predicted aspartyl protease
VLPDDQLAISLLGGSFLGRLARYEVRDGTLIFEN